MVVPILRRLNAAMALRPAMKGWTFGIGNAEASKPAERRLHWEFGRADAPRGGYQADRMAKTIIFRQVPLIAVIRGRRAATASSQPGLSDADYQAVEQVLREIFIALDTLCSGDWEAEGEDWTETGAAPGESVITLRQPLTIRVKVQHDPYKVATIETATPEGDLVP